MPYLKEFHKPTDLPAALTLLSRKNPRTVPLAGGTWLNPRIGKEVLAEAVVDLSGLRLDQIERDADTLRLGAMATLAAVTKDETCCSLANGILAQTARRDAAINVRNAATVGGTVVVAPVDSEFILALLALGAELSVLSEETTTWPLHQFLADSMAALDGGLVTQVGIHLPVRAASGLARVARTPSDHPIVAAVAVITEDADAMRIALGGVARRPLLVEFDRPEAAEEAVAQVIAAAEPHLQADFRGTADYRRAMGALMAKRAFEMALGERNQVFVAPLTEKPGFSLVYEGLNEHSTDHQRGRESTGCPAGRVVAPHATPGRGLWRQTWLRDRGMWGLRRNPERQIGQHLHPADCPGRWWNRHHH